MKKLYLIGSATIFIVALFIVVGVSIEPNTLTEKWVDAEGGIKLISFAQETFLPEEFKRLLESKDSSTRYDACTNLANQGSVALPWIQKVLVEHNSSYLLRVGVITALNQMQNISANELSLPAITAITKCTRPDSTLHAQARLFILKHHSEIVYKLDGILAEALAQGGRDYIVELAQTEFEILYMIGIVENEQYKSRNPKDQGHIEKSISAFKKAWELRTLLSPKDRIMFAQALYGWGHARHDRSSIEHLPDGERDLDLITAAQEKFREFVEEVLASESELKAYRYPEHLEQALAYLQNPIAASIQRDSMTQNDSSKDETTPKDGAKVRLIPEGYFIYGISRQDLESIYKYDGVRTPQLKYEVDENRIRYLPAYYIDKYEVTNKQYAKFLEETGHRKPKYWDNPKWNQPDQPVVGIGLEDAEAYCRWAGKRLPTEEEWEKAARGTDGRLWPWGNEFQRGNCNSDELKKGSMVSVGSFPKGISPYGVHDMAGNVWEIVECQEGSYLWKGLIMRGGSFLSRDIFVRTTVRWSPRDDETGSYLLGFRCVQDIE